MADDISIKDASDETRNVATDEVDGRGFQLVKVCFGADGAVSLVDGTGNPLPVSVVGTVPISGALTDTELRTSPVPISGTVAISGGVAIAGSVEVVNDSGNPLPVSAGSLPLPTGAATEATLASIVKAEDAAHASGDAGVQVLAVRADTDGPMGADGDYGPLQLNAVGRLKVSTQPGLIAPTTGNITGNGQTVACDVSRASNVMLYCTGTFSTVNCAFEGSIDGGTTWFAVQAVRSNANTVETTTGNLSAAPAYAWEMSVNGLTNVRVRATAFTSGTQVWRIQPAPYATEPIPAIQVAAVTQSGSWTLAAGTALIADVSPGVRTTATNAALVSKLIAAGTTNATSVKASAGRVYGWSYSNTAASARYVKLYNKASAPTVGTDTPVMLIAIPAGQSVTQFVGPGVSFATGIALATTTGYADADTGAVTAGDVVGTLFYA